VQGKSGSIILLILGHLTELSAPLNLRESLWIVRKELDWREKADILALGDEEC
jgi:hypothetical protein